MLEVARCLNRLINQGAIPQPRRSIRFLFGAEFFEISSYLANNKERIPKMIAGLNVDDVGGNPTKEREIFVVGRTAPYRDVPSFADDLLEGITERFSEKFSIAEPPDRKIPFHWEVGRHVGGESTILSDPLIGIPTPGITYTNHKTYHTSYDTPEIIEPVTLKRSGIIAAVYAYLIANADKDEAYGLAEEITSRAKIRIIKEIQKNLHKFSIEEDKSKMLDTMERKVGYLKEREIEALDSLLRLIPRKDSSQFATHLSSLKKQIKQTVQSEYDRVELFPLRGEKRALRESGITREELKKDLQELREEPTLFLCEQPEGKCKYCDRVREAIAQGKLIIKAFE